MMATILRLCREDGQDIAEYAVMLAVILVIVVGTVQLIGSNANNVFLGWRVPCNKLSAASLPIAERSERGWRVAHFCVVCQGGEQ